jgi:two-component system nitrogen regulation response regulator NtrX
MIKDKILIIDDEAGIRSSLKGILEDEDYSVQTSESGEQALELLNRENFDLIILDIWLPKMNGIEVLRGIKSLDKNTQVVMITGHGSVETAVKATKLGAFDFLEKPLTLEKVILTAKNALRQKKLEEENILLRDSLKAKFHLIGKSPSVQKLRTIIKTMAPTDGPILIHGENGTGKGLVARLIHQHSQRKNRRFVPVNCAAIPEELLESELFGSVSGALPKGEREKKGKILFSAGGTLFLDEIGEMNLNSQAKIVKFIQDKIFEPVGTSHSTNVDARIIAATNKNMQDYVARGKFREDLYFRLNVIPLHLAPLRERKEDIPLLVRYFLKHISLEYGKRPKTMNRKAMDAFKNYTWPGNTSELVNVIERFVIMIKEDEIKASHLPLLVEPRESEFIPGLDEKQTLERAREQFERDYIHKTLVRHNWDTVKAARELKVRKDRFHEKMKTLGISFLG